MRAFVRPAEPAWCRYTALWVFLNALVIIINKYILSYAGFPFPIALTLIHMAFCAGLATILIKAGVSDTCHMDRGTYMRSAVSHVVSCVHSVSVCTWLLSALTCLTPLQERGADRSPVFWDPLAR